MNNKTKVVFILDRSGSMSHLREDTIGSFNSLVEEQRSKEGECIISTVLFDNYVDVLHDNLEIEKVKTMTREDYFTRGTTALLDAIGITINRTIGQYKDLYREERPDNVMFVIITDGMENASKRFSYSKIKKMISNTEEEFVFFDNYFKDEHLVEVFLSQSLKVDGESENFKWNKKLENED